MLTFWRSYCFYRRHGGRCFSFANAIRWAWLMRGEVR